MMTLPALPASIPRTRSPFGAWLGQKVLTMFGWQVEGNFPNVNKMVVAVAPHTSNWDFVFAVAVKLAIQIEIKFLGKHSLFYWPMKPFMEAIGGIPVDRRLKHGLVEQMVMQFEHRDSLVLAIAPEGTRSKTVEWKTGFLQIAHKANVPVVPICLDFSQKKLIIKAPRTISADIAHELTLIKREFPACCAKYPENV